MQRKRRGRRSQCNYHHLRNVPSVFLINGERQISAKTVFISQALAASNLLWQVQTHAKAHKIFITAVDMTVNSGHLTGSKVMQLQVKTKE